MSDSELLETIDRLTNALIEARKDSRRLDYIQSGHCILCLSKQNGQGYIFELDGHQCAPQDMDVRKLIDKGINENSLGRG